MMRRLVVLAFTVVFCLLTAHAQALTAAQKTSLYGDADYYWGDQVASASACGQSTSLTGGDRETMVWNYFKSKSVLSDPQIAGVMGNLKQESHYDPTDLEKGGDSQNPNDAGTGKLSGWGIAQWTPGSRVFELFKTYNITGPVYELGPQLDLVWAEMNGTAPTGRKDVITGLEQINDAALAAVYFDAQFEGGTDPGGIRETYATGILQKYGSGGTTTTTTTTPAPATGSTTTTTCGSPDCTIATGNAKILCEAQKYEGIYYRFGGGHQGYAAFIAACPDPSQPGNNQPTGAPPLAGGLSGNPSPCATDCSSLVSIALDEAFNHAYMWTVDAGHMAGAGANGWSKVDVSQVQPGDIVTTSEHVEIVDHINGDKLSTFGSHDTGSKTGLVSSSTSYWTGAWRWNDTVK